jgi:hypothetical protein
MKIRNYMGFTIEKVAVPQIYNGRPRVFYLYLVKKNEKEFPLLSEYTLKETKVNIDNFVLNNIQ